MTQEILQKLETRILI